VRYIQPTNTTLSRVAMHNKEEEEKEKEESMTLLKNNSLTTLEIDRHNG
jgi:hypothetical protein